ncbi:hypothetical protein MJG53_006276, partial [Ovis ammon polii x Ovis aries]
FNIHNCYNRPLFQVNFISIYDRPNQHLALHLAMKAQKSLSRRLDVTNSENPDIPLNPILAFDDEGTLGPLLQVLFNHLLSGIKENVVLYLFHPGVTPVYLPITLATTDSSSESLYHEEGKTAREEQRNAISAVQSLRKTIFSQLLKLWTVKLYLSFQNINSC